VVTIPTPWTVKTEIPNLSVKLLDLDYAPEHWPPSGKFETFAAVINKPWEGGTHWRSYYDSDLKAYDAVRGLLRPHDVEWVECHCVAALVLPGYEGGICMVMINGLHICNVELKKGTQQALLERAPQKLTKVVTCNAKIDGGGQMPDGRYRSYGISLDLPKILTHRERLDAQRPAERQQLYRRFRLKVIQDHFRNKFFEIFGDRCFKCDSTDEVLQIDHHIPMVLGGHLVPGNLVALCERCNNKKSDKHPVEFYSAKKLEELQPLLEKQKDIFEFEFDSVRWHEDPDGYLISLGIGAQLVRELFADPDHFYHVGRPASWEQN
jgi:5-methylcytosine-specific restriction endonuclease McrA